MGVPVDSPDVETVYLTVYRTFMEAVDAVDNGVNQYDTSEPPRYAVNTSLPSRVGNLNPAWNVPHDNAELDRRFRLAMALAGAEFEEAVQYTASAWLPARTFVKQSLELCTQAHASGAPALDTATCAALDGAICAALDGAIRAACRVQLARAPR